ncbi:MAG TPA: C69 family dipeptidase [Thermoleophilia bacterium]
MKKLLLVVLGLCLVLAVAASAAAVVSGGASSPPSAPLAAQAASPQHWCNFVLAGKNATADGSVMMGYNNDWSANNYQYLQVVPAPDASTYRFVKILTMGGIQEGGINERQLSVNYGAFTDLDKAVLAADPYERKGYGGELWDLILQKCSTADQALDLLAQMAATKGFSSGAAGSFGFADKNEVWVFELLGGRHWVAARVPDNAVLAHPNMLVVRQIDLNDPANFRGSADLQAFAESIGRYSQSDGPFDVAWAYGDRTELQSYYNTNRMWGALNRLAPSLGLQPEMPFATRPVWVVPDHPVTRQDIMAVNRYHYEGTTTDQTAGYTLMSPHAQTNRPICYATTDYSAVWQMRSGLPDAVGGVVWIAPSLSLTPAMPYATRPVWVVPDHRVSRQDIMAVNRYHYEGTAIDQTAGYSLMSPHAQTNRPICYSTTDYSAVWQSRGWLPDAVGGVVWIAPSRPCSSTFVPFYAGITSVPTAWTGKTAYSAFRAVADSLDKNGTVSGQIRYKYYSPLVRSTYGAFETEVTNAQASTEAYAKTLTGTAQATYLTNYSSQRATQAYNLALSLPLQMP